jgi:hypothetical protein
VDIDGFPVPVWKLVAPWRALLEVKINKDLCCNNCYQSEKFIDFLFFSVKLKKENNIDGFPVPVWKLVAPWRALLEVKINKDLCYNNCFQSENFFDFLFFSVKLKKENQSDFPVPVWKLVAPWRALLVVKIKKDLCCNNCYQSEKLLTSCFFPSNEGGHRRLSGSGLEIGGPLAGSARSEDKQRSLLQQLLSE